MRLAPRALLFATDSAYLELFSFEGAFFVWRLPLIIHYVVANRTLRWRRSFHPIRCDSVLCADLRVLETTMVSKFNHHFIIADFYQRTDQKIERGV